MRDDAKGKRGFSTQLAYVFGIVLIALGTVLMTKADLGLSMVVAPAYLIFLKLSTIWSFVTFGMAEYTLQTVLLIAMMLILRKFRLSYFFSFVTAIIYGLTLDGLTLLLQSLSAELMGIRILFFAVGLCMGAAGVSCMFHTYISPEVYELFVKEVSKAYSADINKFKIGYDCCSCIVAICMSFAFFGLMHFEGVKLGTVVCALLNGRIIGFISRFLESHWEFKDSFKLRRLFES